MLTLEKEFMKQIILIGVAVFITSCANPINLHTANKYFIGGKNNAAQGKWFNARMSFGRAWTNADLGKAGDRETAVYAYEYGRASGAICDWVEAERGLLKALELDTKTNGPVHMSYVELGRMYKAKGDYLESVKYFSLAKNKLDEIQADTSDSIGYASILKDYSEALNKLGKNVQASAITKREQEIRNVFKGRESRHDITPYGKHCDQNSLSYN